MTFGEGRGRSPKVTPLPGEQRSVFFVLGGVSSRGGRVFARRILSSG